LNSNLNQPFFAGQISKKFNRNLETQGHKQEDMERGEYILLWGEGFDR